MRFVLILMMGWGAPALAQDTPPAAQVEQLPLQDIIRQQLDAFNARDVDLRGPSPAR